MEKQMKCSHCGQVFTTIPDRNSFGEVCLCNTCLQQVPNLTITSTKLKSTHLSIKQLDEAILAIDQQLDKGHFFQDIKEGIHTYLISITNNVKVWMNKKNQFKTRSNHRKKYF